MPDLAVFKFDQGGQEAQCTLAFTTSLSTGDDVAQAMKSYLWDTVKNQMSSACTLVDITAYFGGEPSILNVSEVGGGGGGSTCLPVTNALLVTKHTVSGRNGRLFWPGLAEADVDEAGRLTATALTSQQNAWDLVPAALNTGGVTPMVYRAAGAGTYVQIDAFNVRPYIGTQRRRLF